ncbi:MAG: GAF domain-containing protein, partial [candidate division KSB1 bacterium]|nr:GAF domain-containing protein [candidate division KSB1 bacterium]
GLVLSKDGRVLDRTVIEEAGLTEGDRIVSVEGKPAEQLSTILAQKKKGETVRLTFQHGEQRREVALTVGTQAWLTQEAWYRRIALLLLFLIIWAVLFPQTGLRQVILGQVAVVAAFAAIIFYLKPPARPFVGLQFDQNNIIQRIVSGSNGEKAGFQVGDQVLARQGAFQIGQIQRFQLKRGEQTLEIQVPLSKRPFSAFSFYQKAPFWYFLSEVLLGFILILYFASAQKNRRRLEWIAMILIAAIILWGTLVHQNLLDATRAWWQWTRSLFTWVALGFFLAAGAVAFWKRPQDRLSRFFVLCNFSFLAPLILWSLPYFSGIQTSILLFSYWSLLVFMGAWFPSLFLHFFWVFPEEVPVVKRTPVIIYLIHCLGIYGLLHFLAEALQFQQISPPALYRALFYIYLVLGIVSVGYTYAVSKDSRARQQLRVLFYGVILCLLAIILAQLWIHRAVAEKPAGVFYGFVALIPVTLAYTIVGQRLLNINALVAKSLGYIFLILFSIIVFLALWLILTNILASKVKGSELMVALIAALGVAVLFSPAKSRLGHWMERLFCKREVYIRQQLQQLQQEVGFITHMLRLQRVLVRRIADVMNSQMVALLMPNQDATAFEITDGVGLTSRDKRKLQFKSSGGFMVWLKMEKQPLYLPELVNEERYRFLGKEEKEKLKKLQATVCLPLIWSDQLMGVIVLGPRPQNESYSTKEVELLASVAQQAALAMENARVQRQISSLQREVATLKSQLQSAEKHSAQVEEVNRNLLDYIKLGLLVLKRGDEIIPLDEKFQERAPQDLDQKFWEYVSEQLKGQNKR